MKILFLSYDLPYPLDQGGKIRAYHLIKNLSRKHKITLFSFFRRESQRQYLSQLRPFCEKIVLFPRMKVFSITHFLNSLRISLPFPAALYYSAQLKKQLTQEVNDGGYDILHYESFYTSGYLDQAFKIPQILGTENIEWRVYWEYTQKKPGPWRYLMQFEIARMRRFEERTWRQADTCLAVSLENAQEIERITGKNCYFVPNGVDLEFFQYQPPQSHQRPIILFVGNFSYIQNQDAARFLVKEIFPLIKKESPRVKLLIVGRNPSREIQSWASGEIELRADIEDIRQAYQRADVLLAPIRAGSGTKFKILEAMASGLPVVTTRRGIEGIKAKDGQEAIVREEPEQLASQTRKLLSCSDYGRKMAKAARELVVKHYAWPKIAAQLEIVYQETVREQD